MKRLAWLVPALLLAACKSDEGSATYSANHVPRASAPPASSSSTSRPTTTYATPPPTYTPPPSYTPPATATAPRTQPAYTPPPTSYPPPSPATPAPPPPSYAATPPVAPPPPAYTAPAPVPAGFRWAGSLDEACAQARASGRLVFIESGRDACGNCQKLKHTVVPETSGELGAMAVGYYDDCDRDKGSRAFWLLRQNLPNAVTLPLVGWFTPDLRWVSGYSGGADAGRFRQEIAKAQSGGR
ncbi:MAG: hypothetical protein IT460_11125 [Planctomycetes bacterium]|nr:hypothetical protein [Planctomycetota bacterium]